MSSPAHETADPSWAVAVVLGSPPLLGLVLARLGGAELAICACVSPDWRTAAADDALWRSVGMREFPALASAPLPPGESHRSAVVAAAVAVAAAARPSWQPLWALADYTIAGEVWWQPDDKQPPRPLFAATWPATALFRPVEPRKCSVSDVPCALGPGVNAVASLHACHLPGRSERARATEGGEEGSEDSATDNAEWRTVARAISCRLHVRRSDGAVAVLFHEPELTEWDQNAGHLTELSFIGSGSLFSVRDGGDYNTTDEMTGSLDLSFENASWTASFSLSCSHAEAVTDDDLLWALERTVPWPGRVRVRVV